MEALNVRETPKDCLSAFPLLVVCFVNFHEFWKSSFLLIFSLYPVNCIVNFILLFYDAVNYRNLNKINTVSPKGSSSSHMQSQTHKFKFLWQEMRSGLWSLQNAQNCTLTPDPSGGAYSTLWDPQLVGRVGCLTTPLALRASPDVPLQNYSCGIT